MIAICPWVILILATLMLPFSDSAPYPQTAVRVRFTSPTMIYSHGTDSSTIVESGYGRRRLQASRSLLQSSPSITPAEGYPPSRRSSQLTTRQSTVVVPVLSDDPETMWPSGVFLPPNSEILDLILRNDDLLGADPDPYLLTGHDAEIVIKALFNRGEMFYSDYPHARALVRHQEEREANGLAGNRLGSIRPESQFYRWPDKRPKKPVPGYPRVNNIF